MKTSNLLSSLAAILVLILLCGTGLKSQNASIITPSGWEYSETPNIHAVIVLLDANPSINDYQLQPGDYIGAFYTDDYGALKCAGADFWLGDENIIFPVFGDDPDTPWKDGFGFAETMHFKVFSQLTQKDYSAQTLNWDNSYPTTNKWYPLGLSAVTGLACFIDFDVYISTETNPACIGQEVQLQADLFAGTPENLIYSWSSVPAGFYSNQESITVLPAENTVYFLSVTDGVLMSEHQMEVEIHQLPEVICGNDITICNIDCAHLFAEVHNASSVLWETTGDGCFCDPTIANPNYSPGPNDIQNGSVTVIHTASPLSACTLAAYDSMMVSILPLPSIVMSDNILVCESLIIVVEATVDNFSQLSWTTDGDGTFENPDSSETIYLPGPTDLAQKVIGISICATALEPLTHVACKEATIYLQKSPVINSPSTRMVCDRDQLFLNSTPYYYSSVLWETNGDGTFENPELKNTYYFPGEQDQVNGGATLTVYAFGQGACQTFPAFSNTNVVVLPSPSIIMDNEATITEQDTYFILAEISGGNQVEWATSGDGTFVIYTPGVAEYFPGDEDVINGLVEITAQLNATYPCVNGATETLLLNIHRIHHIDIPEGWTGFSSFINQDVTIENLFAHIMDDLIIAQTQTGVFWPQGGVNTLIDFSCSEGYKLKMVNARSLSLIGPAAKNTILNLNPGWNLVPVISSNGIDCQSIVEQLGSNLIIIKEVANMGVVWPAMGIQTIQSLLPGRAYMIAVANATNLDYSICAGYKSMANFSNEFINQTPWTMPEMTTISHIVAFTPHTLTGLQAGDVVAAFNIQGLCTGLAQYAQENEPFALAIYGDEAITGHTEGMMEGERISFKIFRGSNQIIDLEIAETPDSPNQADLFTANGLSVAGQLNLKGAFAEKSANKGFSVFPNPSSGKFAIAAKSQTGLFSVAITDLNGRLILAQTATDHVEMDMSDYPRGMYLVTITTNTSLDNEKLILR